MAELVAFSVTLNAYKQLLGKNENTDQEFMNWVRKQVIDDLEIEEDSSTMNYTAKLSELSYKEINELFGTIVNIESLQEISKS